MEPFKFSLETAQPSVDVAGGVVRFARKSDFPALSGLAMASIHLQPGAIRIPHWHPNAHEMDYVITGRAQMALFGPKSAEFPEGVVEHFSLQAGEISFLPQGWFHSITNPGPEPLHLLVIFNSDSPLDIGLPHGLGAMRQEVLARTLGISVEAVEQFCTQPEFIVPI